MANPWFRVWTDMVNDPKWRTIARISKQKIGDVIAVYMHMMTCASNATERGRTESWNDEDVATALDIETDQVAAIREAMQGRVLDGDHLSGWEKRQPQREDGSAERSKEWREQQKLAKQMQENATERDRTQPNAREDKEEIKTKKEPKSKASATASRLPADWSLDDDMIQFCKTERPDLNPIAVAERFRDYWAAVPGAKGRKADWPATWRNWVRNEKTVAQPRASPGGSAWWATDQSVLAEGAKMGMTPYAGESMHTFKGRVQAAIDNGGKPPQQQPSRTTAGPIELPKGTMPVGLDLKSLVKRMPA